MHKAITLLGICVLGLMGCGGASPNSLQTKGNGVPAGPTTEPPPPAYSVPTVIGTGMAVRLNIVNDAPLVAWQGSQGAMVSSGATFQGALRDFDGGNVLTELISEDTSISPLTVNGGIVGRTGGQQIPVLDGTKAVWIDFDGIHDSVAGLLYPTSGDILEVAASGGHVAWVSEPLSGECVVFIDGKDIFDDAAGCPMQLKFLGASPLYLGWCDGAGVAIAGSADGTSWEVSRIIEGRVGVVGYDYAFRAGDDVLVVAWTQEVIGEDGSGVWEAEGGAAPRRLSLPTHPGFSGAGNPAVAADGSVAWLDDAHGATAGDFDVYLDGEVVSTRPGVDEGPDLALLADGTRVLAWDDQVEVWILEVTQ